MTKVKEGRSIIIDGEIQKKFTKYCNENGYIIGILTGKLINKFLEEKKSEGRMKIELRI